MEYTFTFSSVSWSTNTGEDFLAALWGNMSTTTVNIQGTYLLCWIQWRNLFFCIQPPAKGVRENMFLRLLNWSETSKIPYLWLKHCLKFCKPSEGPGFLFSDTPPYPRKQNYRNPILIPINPSWGHWESLSSNLQMGLSWSPGVGKTKNPKTSACCSHGQSRWGT